MPRKVLQRRPRVTVHHIGLFVRIRPGGPISSGRHFRTGRLIMIVGDCGIVQVSHHKKPEKIPLDRLHEWRSANSNGRGHH